jgi:hypothetical protein
MNAQRPALPDPFEETLRRHLGPHSLQSPPAELRARLLERAAQASPTPEQFRLNRARLLRAALPSLLGLGAGWLLVHWAPLLGRMVSPGLRDSLLQLVARRGWLELLHSPLGLALLPLFLLPFLYLLQDESAQG